MRTLLLLLAMTAFAAAQPSVNPRNVTDYGCWIASAKYWLVGVGSEECESIVGTWKLRISPSWSTRSDNSSWHGVGQ